MFYSLRAAPPRPLINEEVLKVSVSQVCVMKSMQPCPFRGGTVSTSPKAENPLQVLYFTLLHIFYYHK